MARVTITATDEAEVIDFKVDFDPPLPLDGDERPDTDALSAAQKLGLWLVDQAVKQAGAVQS